MNTLFGKASRNFLLQHPWQLTLAIIGIALGVAVVISIDLAMESSLRSFRLAEKIFSGKVSHRIIAASGRLDEKLYTRLRVEQGVENVSPVVQDDVRIVRNGERSVKLYGIDPLSEQALQAGWQVQSGTGRMTDLSLRLISEPNTALLGKQAALRLQLETNDVLSVVTAHGVRRLKVIGLLEADNVVQEQALADLIITDIATAQEVLGWYGKLSAINVYRDSRDQQTPAKISAVLPETALLVTPQSEATAMRQMTRAFSINLTALGLLSLLVGMFLIYNTMTFLVIQRRRLIGNLRCIGVTRRQIFQIIIFEAGCLALCGTAVGVLLGILLAHGMLQLVAATIDTLYFPIDQVGLLITPWQIGKGVLLGIAATLLAVLAPAWEATHWPPGSVLQRSQLETGMGRLLKSALWFGCGFIACGLILAFFSADSVALGLTGIFLLVFGFAALTPVFTLVVMQGLERLGGRHSAIMARLPPRLVRAEISRTGIAIAALMIAVSVTIGMDLMIGSFRGTVEQWLQTSLRADFYVGVADNKMSTVKANIGQRVKQQLAALPETSMLSSILRTKVIVQGRVTPVSVFELNARSQQGFILKQAAAGDVWERFEQQPAVMVTEPYAYFNGIKVGQTINLQTNRGLKPFQVIAVYADYSGDQGHLAISRENFLRYWPGSGYSGIGIYARPGTNLERLQQQVRELLPAQLTVRSDAAIFKASMQIFAQTFTITETLRWLAALIAFVGVFSALMALQLERTRQFGMLRAIGVTPGQLTALITAETGLMGLVAGLFALPVGYSVAYVLIYVIYQRSFGWTMAFQVDVSVFWQGLLLAFGAAVLAGIYPAYKMSQTKPAEALRTE